MKKGSFRFELQAEKPTLLVGLGDKEAVTSASVREVFLESRTTRNYEIKRPVLEGLEEAELVTAAFEGIWANYVFTRYKDELADKRIGLSVFPKWTL